MIKRVSRKHAFAGRLVIGILACGILTGCAGNLLSTRLISTADSDESLSGGVGTEVIDNDSVNALGHIRPDISAQEAAKFSPGRSFFQSNWVVAGNSTEGRDGLGPIFNATACTSCHLNDGRSAPPAEGDEFVALLLRLSIAGTGPNGGPNPHPIYGSQLQNNAILGVKAEGTPRVRFSTISGQFPDGTRYTLQHPTFTIENPNYGPLGDVMISPRTAPPIMGMGLLEIVAESTIVALADPSDANGDGVSGRPNYVWDVAAQSLKIGRFGWKANQPTVLQQVQGAFSGDIGITSSLFPDENYAGTGIESELSQYPSGGHPEATEQVIELVTAYARNLAVPARRHLKDPAVIRGKQLFTEMNCVACHRPELPTPIGKIRPFTDLLLHDMGPGLADGRPDFSASGQEWRTPPLWGIGLTQKVNGHTRFLHDGRARNLEEAILWHGGEAEKAKTAYTQLTQSDRAAVIAFLNSL